MSGRVSAKTPTTPSPGKGKNAISNGARGATQNTDTRGGGNDRRGGVSTSWATWNVSKGNSKLSTGGAGRRVQPPVP
jgi:hypothetical protein